MLDIDNLNERYKNKNGIIVYMRYEISKYFRKNNLVFFARKTVTIYKAKQLLTHGSWDLATLVYTL